MDVTVVYDDTPERDIRTITHDTGGEAAIEYTGSWKREWVIGSGGSGVVYLESHVVTNRLRAVKQLMKSNDRWEKREIDCMLQVREVT